MSQIRPGAVWMDKPLVGVAYQFRGGTQTSSLFSVVHRGVHNESHISHIFMYVFMYAMYVYCMYVRYQCMYLRYDCMNVPYVYVCAIFVYMFACMYSCVYVP